MSALDQMTKFIPLGQIFLFDRKGYFLLDKANFFMDDPHLLDRDEVLFMTRQKVGHRCTLDEVFKAASQMYGVQVEEILALGKQRGVSEARAMICWLVREASHLSLTELSRQLNRELSSLSQAATRLIKRSKVNADLANRMVKMKSELL